MVRIFELYSTGAYTFDALVPQLATEGHTFRESQPRFHRTALSYILNNRIYIGEIKRGDNHFPGKHEPLIDRATFAACQRILNGKNRVSVASRPNHALAGGLFTCAYCGSMITGERIRRKLKGGGVRIHQYYRCASNQRSDDHPSVRWKEADLDEAVANDLGSLQLPSQEVADWFRESLKSAFADLSQTHRDRSKLLQKQKTELTNKQNRLLDAFLGGTIEESIFKAKQQELNDEAARVEEALEAADKTKTIDVESALAVFDFSQNAAEIWRRSKMDSKRELLESLSLNRTLSDVSLLISKRKPFDILAERPLIQLSRDDRI